MAAQVWAVNIELENLVMKMIALSLGALLLLATAGCETEVGYGGGLGIYGEYPDAYYGYNPAPNYEYGPSIYVHPGPYDRDHYWDRDRHWERHRWR